MRLEGKVAIVTGAGQGIGKTYARRFLDEGARVAIVDIDAGRGESAAAELADSGEVAFVQADISAEESTENCVRQVVERFGQVDVLLNNAGIYYDMDYGDQSYEYLRQVFDINCYGAWLMSKAATPHLVERGGGSIINVSSTGAYLYVKNSPTEFSGISSYAYPWSKWGVVGLTKMSAGELGRWGIRVNCIAPGVTVSEATRKQVPEDRIAAITAMSALKRTLTPEDLTGTAVFFASEDSALVTGQMLCVDAGVVMPG
ncbi:SDR family NAD(P)-dependent oxidoreductase [Nocardia jinanensis]|uniref:Short-chain dehydrogenase n=1 Tax=Nocardia jinanensis TaxID=382504 RepID=A0A917RLZ6_9NOCA|nr:SDR family oxidoreductase [Nocardia jinanensis]GGL14883.1 short-chain dehydrogenase [Nocardia jinanensis]